MTPVNGLEMLSTQQAADRLGVSLRTVQRYVANGTLVAVSIPLPTGAHTHRIPAAAIDHLLVAALEELESRAELAELGRLLREREAARSGHSCPRCGHAPVDPESTYGWCVSCTTQRQIEEDIAAERERARKLRWWESDDGRLANMLRNERRKTHPDPARIAELVEERESRRRARRAAERAERDRRRVGAGV